MTKVRFFLGGQILKMGDMPKQCRSINRALRRGHPLNSGSSTYMSKKESRILKEIYRAALKKMQNEEENTQIEKTNE